jgi:hypothetical protein
MRHRTLVVALLVALGAGASAAREEIRDVGWVADNALSIKGRKIEVAGFLSRIGNYYFLSEGLRRPLGSRQPAGFWCNFGGSPAKLWFAQDEMGPMPRGLFVPDDIGVGKKVMIRADFFGERQHGLTEPSPLVAEDGEAFSRHELGPLKHVRILRIFGDSCSGAAGFGNRPRSGN